jgi:hypothetical protein
LEHTPKGGGNSTWEKHTDRRSGDPEKKKQKKNWKKSPSKKTKKTDQPKNKSKKGKKKTPRTPLLIKCIQIVPFPLFLLEIMLDPYDSRTSTGNVYSA